MWHWFTAIVPTYYGFYENNELAHRLLRANGEGYLLSFPSNSASQSEHCSDLFTLIIENNSLWLVRWKAHSLAQQNRTFITMLGQYNFFAESFKVNGTDVPPASNSRRKQHWKYRDDSRAWKTTRSASRICFIEDRALKKRVTGYGNLTFAKKLCAKLGKRQYS